MDKKMIDLFFKALAAGLVPLLFWVNSQSVDLAVEKQKVSRLEQEADDLKGRVKELEKKQQETEGLVRELNVTIGFVRSLLTEINNRMNGHGN
jgi:predicted transcriptional regulator